MKQAALQALQHVRTTLAYQLTPEAVSELLEPIQKALNLPLASPQDYEFILAHNEKADRAEKLITWVHESAFLIDKDGNGFLTAEAAMESAMAAVRALRI